MALALEIQRAGWKGAYVKVPRSLLTHWVHG